MSSERVAARLRDVYVEIVLAGALVQRLERKAFGQDAFAQRTLTRSVEIVCEAVVHIEQAIGRDGVERLLPGTSARTLRDAGNFLRHEYRKVSWAVIWDTVTMDFPPLEATVRDALEGFGPVVPTYDLSVLTAAPSLLHDALAETGFVVVTDHGIDLTRLHDAYAAIEAFFALPEAEKRAYMIGRDGQRGYTPFGREHAKDSAAPDLKEFWHVGREEIAPNVWPDRPERFHAEVQWLYDALDGLGLKLLRALTEPLGVPEDTFDEMAVGGNSVLRLLHYPPLEDDADPRSIRAAAHEDINLITLLVSASAAGLQLRGRDGRWHAVDAPPDAVIVDSGDMLARITNGALPATTHRVVNPEGPNTSRYSMPFFLHPRPGAVLSVFDRYKDGTEDPDITAGDFLRQRLEEIGLA